MNKHINNYLTRDKRQEKEFFKCKRIEGKKDLRKDDKS